MVTGWVRDRLFDLRLRLYRRVVILRSSASAMVVRKRPKYGRSVTSIKIVTRSGVSHGSLTRGCVIGLRTRYLSSHTQRRPSGAGHRVDVRGAARPGAAEDRTVRPHNGSREPLLPERPRSRGP